MKTTIYSSFVVLVTTAFSIAAADYTGTFKGDSLKVTLQSSAGRYSGTLQIGDKDLPCTARETAERLTGWFESDGNQFAFTATLQGTTLILQSGGTSYTLQKQAVPVNPLARPAAVNPLAKPAISGGGTGAPVARHTATTNASIIRFRKVSINDQPDMIGGEAFSFLAPADWKTEGGLVWRAHPTMPAAVALRVINPMGLEQLECFPTVAFSWGGYLGPGTMFPPGANYLGNEVQPPVKDAIAYLTERHLPRVRGQAQVRVVRTEALPKLAEVARQAEPSAPFGGPVMVFTAGRVRIAYEVGGKMVEEDLYCVLNSMALPGGNMTIQIADKLYGLRASQGQLDQATKLFETIIHSTRISLPWFNRYAQLVQVLTQAQMNQIRAAGELSRYLSRTSSEISDMMRQSYEQRQASQDRINKNWSLYMRGVDEYHDPVAGRAVELPSGYQNAWVNGRGEYVVTDSAIFNPNVELDGTWSKLERKEP
jgi:hypothetical protein